MEKRTSGYNFTSQHCSWRSTQLSLLNLAFSVYLIGRIREKKKAESNGKLKREWAIGNNMKMFHSVLLCKIKLNWGQNHSSNITTSTEIHYGHYFITIIITIPCTIIIPITKTTTIAVYSLVSSPNPPNNLPSFTLTKPIQLMHCSHWFTR